MKAPKPSSNPSSKNKKGIRPYNRYNVYFILERENVITSGGGSTNLSSEARDPNRKIKYHGFEDLNLPPLPPRFANLELPLDWYIPGRGQKKRAHRKTHGVANFLDLAKGIAKSWKTIDETTLEWCTEVERILKKRYVELNEKDGVVQAPPTGRKQAKSSRTSRNDDGAEPVPYGIDAASLPQSSIQSKPLKKRFSINDEVGHHQETRTNNQGAANNNNQAWGGMPRPYGVDQGFVQNQVVQPAQAPQVQEAPALIRDSFSLAPWNSNNNYENDEADDESLEDHEPIHHNSDPDEEFVLDDDELDALMRVSDVTMDGGLSIDQSHQHQAAPRSSSYRPARNARRCTADRPIVQMKAVNFDPPAQAHSSSQGDVSARSYSAAPSQFPHPSRQQQPRSSVRFLIEEQVDEDSDSNTSPDANYQDALNKLAESMRRTNDSRRRVASMMRDVLTPGQREALLRAVSERMQVQTGVGVPQNHIHMVADGRRKLL